MEVRTGSVFIGPSRGAGPQERLAAPIVFPREIRQAVVGITGYSAGFRGDDHHLGRLIVSTRYQVTFNTVSVTVALGLRDWSGDWDDTYTGLVNFAVLAELAPVTDPPSRPDLIITDAEITQVTQHFRSATFLDPVNVRPDNSIPLLARKATAVRLWIDYQADPALPPIGVLRGELDVVGGAGSVLLDPVEGIVPRRESLILRSERGHTLNFIIPEERCQGIVTIRARAFSALDSTQRSALLERTLHFVEVDPVQVHLVGVEDASVTPPRAAPSYGDMRNLLALAEQWYPYGEIADTGYETLRTTYDYEGDVATQDPAGWDDLLEDLGDLRGSAPEIYVAELPAGTPTGNIGGVSNFADAGAFSFGNASSAAHELGHCLGREHPPCDTCSPPPADPDGSYPRYGPFARDSIGEFGFDVVGYRVLNPANTFDFMGYSSPEWVSPYTYKGLSGSAAIFEGAAFARGPGGKPPRATRGNQVMVPREALYLQLDIQRDRRVSRRHSFHYAVIERVGGRHATPFTVELHDDKGKVLVCAPLSHSGAGGVGKCGCRACWPVRVRDMIPFPGGARKLVVWEDRTAVYDETIPTPPRVRITAKAATADGILLEWTAAADPPAELWYIVQYVDRRGVWRGVAPRTPEPRLLLPQRRFAGMRLTVRVLASSGLATGAATEVLEFARSASPSDPSIVLVGPTSGDIPRFIRAKAPRPELGLGSVAWFDEQGAELSAGAVLDTGRLPEGDSVIRAVASGTGLLTQRAWLAVKKGASVVSIRDIVPRPPAEPHRHPHSRV